jgi:hypothetical protein
MLGLLLVYEVIILLPALLNVGLNAIPTILEMEIAVWPIPRWKIVPDYQVMQHGTRYRVLLRHEMEALGFLPRHEIIILLLAPLSVDSYVMLTILEMVVTV